jgi:hypothetical protein
VLPEHGGYVLPPNFPIFPIGATTTTYINSFKGGQKVLFLDGMNIGKEHIGGWQARRNGLKQGHLTPADLDPIQCLDKQGVPFVMVLNRKVMEGSRSSEKLSTPFTDKLLREGRLILVNCSGNPAADDRLLIQLTVTYRGIMVSKDKVSEHIKEMSWFSGMIRGFFFNKDKKFLLGWNPRSL